MAPGSGLDTGNKVFTDAGNDERQDNGKTDDDNLFEWFANSPSVLDEELAKCPFGR